jgi:hypothetical protein
LTVFVYAQLLDKDCEKNAAEEYSFILFFSFSRSKVEQLSVFGRKDRTNNVCESFHSQLHTIFNTHHAMFWSILVRCCRKGSIFSNLN